MNKYEQIKGMANSNRGSVGVQEARPPQRTEQEPVACANGCKGFFKHTTPPQRTWVGLTDEQIDTIGDKVANEKLVGAVPNFRVRFARAIEAKLKELYT